MWSLAERIILSPQELIRSIISPVWFGRLTGSYGAFLVLLRRPEVSFAFQRQTLVPDELGGHYNFFLIVPDKLKVSVRLDKCKPDVRGPVDLNKKDIAHVGAPPGCLHSERQTGSRAARGSLHSNSLEA